MHLNNLGYISHDQCAFCWICRTIISTELELFICTGFCSRSYHKSCLKYHQNIKLSKNNQLYTDSTVISANSIACDNDNTICYFCWQSYVGCNYCHKFIHLNKVIKCSIKTCTNFYCRNSCLARIRVIYLAKQDLIAYFTNMKLPLEVLDICEDNIICHSHFCYSCYDCDKYMYTWEKCWRKELFNSKSRDASIAWDFLRRTCKGSIESSHFNKGKYPIKPPRMPALLRINLPNRATTDNGILTQLRQLNKLTQNTIYSCIRCDMCWCIRCLPPDASYIVNCKNNILCHNCLHQQIHREISRLKTQRSTHVYKNSDISLNIHSNSQNIYRQLKSVIKAAKGDISYINKSFIVSQNNVYSTFSNSEVSKSKYNVNYDTYDNYPIKDNTPTCNSISIGVNDIKKDEKQDNLDSTKTFIGNSVFIPGERLNMYDILPPNFTYLNSNYCTEETKKFLKVIDAPDCCNCAHVCDRNCNNRSRGIECHSGICKLGDIDCGNRRLANYTQSKLYISRVEKKGYGVFASDYIYEGELVCEYTGEVTNHDLYQKRLLSRCFSELDDGKHNHWYIMKIQKDVYIDSTRMGNISRYINHSCEPNCQSMPISYRGTIHMCIFSKRTINPNEEITYNYGFQSYGLYNGFNCACGSNKCRGIIGTSSNDSSLEKALIRKLDGTTMDSLNDLLKDMQNLFTIGNNSSLKPRPIPLDVINGLFTSGDLEANDRLINTNNITKHLNICNKIRKLLINNNEVDMDYRQVLSLLKAVNRGLLALPVDIKSHTHIEYLYTKLIALNGLSLENFSNAKTKKFAIDLPWSIIAYEYNPQKSLNTTSNPEFFIAAKRFFQCYTLVNVSNRFGRDALSNVQNFFDLSWGLTENCVACGGYGDCTVCDSCGNVLHDKISCGDFVCGINYENICSVCQNSNHRSQWYLKSTLERERLALKLSLLRLNKMFINSVKYYGNFVPDIEAFKMANEQTTPLPMDQAESVPHIATSQGGIFDVSSIAQYVNYVSICNKLVSENANFL
ncbi:histone-lysine N-methyltransferase SETD2 [Babesia microti strain RI]|uniref:Histone-lysine N-methyltransferase SETD2 n=1 Tax=Babesia microti (strain RI) TaxID=1133968 RepID=I7ISC2_BABMR|nr:histone-lysine N-methyltransferase SETD2 [Babesia microti strain RI]CCF75531.1 histone-lysine N-methyltransferase SETD2 [Babesia microti strain RI]|eukprot:XP_012649939.1 histone-lysine N-methyltransferase SETD2 [Babesia microti strain RI]